MACSPYDHSPFGKFDNCIFPRDSEYVRSTCEILFVRVGR